MIGHVMLSGSLLLVILACSASGSHAAAQQQQQQQSGGSTKPIPALQPGTKPNFIMILTDDVGYDDLGFHNPRVNTPNINRFRQRSTVFENFYTSPQCAQSRAQFLTGRSYAKTGTMAVSGGWDFINRDEVTIGEALAAGGYRTAHFGKWHNLQVLGYEPWHNGFQDGYIPPSTGSDGEGLARVNGRYVLAREEGHVYDKALRNMTIDYLQQRLKDGQPFLVFWAARSIHTNYLLPDPVTGKPTERRIVPAQYRDSFNAPEYNGVAESTKDAWAFMEYLDDALGPVFDFLTSSGLDQSTYLMFTADNGPAVYADENSPQKKRIRMPSGMQGAKHSYLEGGIRNTLIVQGPGVKPGATDSTMIAISDIFPTLVDIAGVGASVPAGLPLDGISFKSVLLPGFSSSKINIKIAEDAAATAGGSTVQQQSSLTWRYLFMLGPACWGPNAVPELRPDRTVLKPQKLLDYHAGGCGWRCAAPAKRGPGFKSCMVVRFRDYKWIGSTNKVYQFSNETQHLEISDNEVTGERGAYLAGKMAKAAQQWWQSVIDSPHSFQKPTYYLGLGNWTVTNMLAAGAHERTPEKIQLIINGATGFYNAGDSMCFKLKVLTAGAYSATAMYTSNIQATFRLSVGTYADIQAGRARSLTVQLPAQDTMRGMLLGNLTLPASKDGELTEACLELLSSTSLDGKTAVFKNLANIQWTRVSSRRLRDARAADDKSNNIQTGIDSLSGDLANQGQDSSSSTGISRGSGLVSTLAAAGDTDAIPVAVPAPGLDVNGRYSGVLNHAARVSPAADAWTAVRLKNAWSDGQSVLESMFSPYDSEGIEECPAGLRAACRPPI